MREIGNLKVNNKTTAFSDDAWANAPLQYTAEVTIPLSNVTEEMVKECDGKVNLTVSVAFNDDFQYRELMTIPFDNIFG